MNIFQIISTVIALIGVSSLVAGLVFIGRKLETLDSISHDINYFIKPELKDLGNWIGALEVHMGAFEVRMGVVEQSLENVEQMLYRNTA